MRKWIFIGLTCVAIVLTVFLADGNTPEKTQAQGSVVTFTGVDLDCKDCQAKMEDALSKIIGIKNYKLHPKQHTVTVTFNHEIMQPDWIEKSLQAAGFSIKDIKE